MNNEIDIALYSTYIENSRGMGSTIYIVLGEGSALIGSTISGMLYSSLSYITLLFILTPVYLLRAAMIQSNRIRARY